MGFREKPIVRNPGPTLGQLVEVLNPVYSERHTEARGRWETHHGIRLPMHQTSCQGLCTYHSALIGSGAASVLSFEDKEVEPQRVGENCKGCTAGDEQDQNADAGQAWVLQGLHTPTLERSGHLTQQAQNSLHGHWQAGRGCPGSVSTREHRQGL